MSGRSAPRSSPRPVPSPSAEPSRWPAWTWWLLVFVPVLVNAVWLAPEFRPGAPSPNDSALHSLMIHAASDALRDGANPLDFWIPQLDLGFPQFLYYQNLPHLAVVGLHRLTFGQVELETLFHVVQYLLLVSFPITVAWSMRTMGFSPVASGVGAAVCSLLSASRYGFEYQSYVWRGIGLYTQLWGMHLSFIALAFLLRTVHEGRGYVRTAVVLALLALSHLVYATMMSVTSVIVLLTAVRRHELVPRAIRLAIAGAIAGALALYMLWPFAATSHEYLSNLPGLRGSARNAADFIAEAFRRGLFDHKRLPLLTLLAVVGLVASAARRSTPRLLALIGFVVWTVLYFGRSEIGSLGGLLPAHSGFVGFRFIGPVCLFGILAMGVGGEAIWDGITRLRALPASWRPVLASFALVALLIPAVVERTQYYRENARLIRETRAALAADVELDAIITGIRDTRGGRIYAGPEDGWGGQMRVGPTIVVSDVLNAQRFSGIGNPFQGLALNASILFNFRDGDPGLYDAFDVRTVITPATASVPGFFSPIFKTTKWAAWRVQTTGATQYVAITDRRRARSQRELFVGASEWFVSNAPLQHSVTRWDYMAPAGPFTPVPPCPDGGTTFKEAVTTQRVTVDVSCPIAGALMFKFSYHPNWHVTVDGAPASTYMVSPSFIGIDLPAGRHTVDARYVATPSKTPLLAFGVLVLVLATVFRGRLDAPAQRFLRAG